MSPVPEPAAATVQHANVDNLDWSDTDSDSDVEFDEDNPYDDRYVACK